MKIITIDSDDHSVLHKKAAEVSLPLGQDSKHQIETMRAFYKSLSNKAGFAAPQVGISKRIILIEESLFDPQAITNNVEPVILINPSWKPLDNAKDLSLEGCLSAPNRLGIVSRYTNVELNAIRYCANTGNLTPIHHTYKREFSCSLWQHEIDHLDGQLHVDKAELVMTEDEFIELRHQLIKSGQLKPGMDFFDMGKVVLAATQNAA